MAQITAQMVKDLREMTGAGMMDCKAALGETSGDVEAAVDWLRKKGLSKAAKKADRVAAEGLIGVAVKGTKGVVVEVNSETDFVARNDLFQGLVKMIANVALDVGADVEKIKAAKTGSKTIADDIAETVAKIGENMTLRRAAGLSVGQGAIGSYVHNAVIDGARQDGRAGRAGIRRQGRRTRRARPAARDACRGGQSAGGRSRRARSGRGHAREGRARRKIQGAGQARRDDREDRRVRAEDLSTRRSACSIRPYIHDDKKSVAQALKEAEGKVGGPIKVTGFVRYELGEGVEKQESDFAAEVAAAAGTKN